MKLLFVTPGRLPVPAKKGGAVETLMDLRLDYNEKKSQHDITVVSVYDSEAKKESRRYRHTRFQYVKMGKIYSYLSNNHLLPYRLLNCFFSWKAVRVLKKNKEEYDYIVIENEPVNGCIFQKSLKGKYVFYAHNSLSDKMGAKEKSFLSSCHKIISISDFLTTDVENVVRAGNAVRVYNGIDVEQFSREKHLESRKRLRAQFGFTEQDTVVLFSGRIVPEKGIEELLKAFMSLDDSEHVKLLVLGSSFFESSKDNSFVQNMKQLCEKKKDKIVFTGYIKHEEIPAYYSAADIGCIPSLWEEPFGLSAVEQMAMELPVIATDAGALKEIVNESCGFIISKSQEVSVELAKYIKILCRSLKMRQEMGRIGREVVCSKFNEQIYSEKWFDEINAEEK